MLFVGFTKKKKKILKTVIKFYRYKFLNFKMDINRLFLQKITIGKKMFKINNRIVDYPKVNFKIKMSIKFSF